MIPDTAASERDSVVECLVLRRRLLLLRRSRRRRRRRLHRRGGLRRRFVGGAGHVAVGAAQLASGRSYSRVAELRSRRRARSMAVLRLAVSGRKIASLWSVVSTSVYSASRAVASMIVESWRTLRAEVATSMLAMLVTAGASASALHHPEKWPCVMSHSFDVGSYGAPHVSEYAMSHGGTEL